MPDPQGYPASLERILKGTAAERNALARLQFAEADAAVAGCMTDAGFAQEYVPAVLIQGTAPTARDLFDPPLPAETAKRIGWGIIDFMLHPPPGPSVDLNTPLQSDAYQHALGLCEDRRDDVPVTQNPIDALSTAANDEITAVSRSLFMDPRFDRPYEAYTACMASEGYPKDNYPPLVTMQDIIARAESAQVAEDATALESLFNEETALAVADSTCRTAEIYQAFLQARADIEAPVIQKHSDQLDAIQSAWTDILDRAPSSSEISHGLISG
jgi:hypothetical protein